MEHAIHSASFPLDYFQQCLVNNMNVLFVNIYVWLGPVERRPSMIMIHCQAHNLHL